jgi:triacylglycerol lipase
MKMRITFSLLLVLAMVTVTTAQEGRPPAEGPAQQAAEQATVVLLHGLGRTHRSMRPVQEALAAHGYRVVNVGYPSRTRPWAELVDSLGVALEACCAGDPRPIHFVTHSMGGILVRAYLETHTLPGLGRVVMLSPPNQGTEVVDRLPEELLRLLLGPAALRLGTDPESVPLQLGPVDFELGVITGDVSLNPLFSVWLDGADDGTIPVESAWVEGVDDFIVVPYTHTFIMRRDEVIAQILSFLEYGRFLDEPPSR